MSKIFFCDGLPAEDYALADAERFRRVAEEHDVDWTLEQAFKKWEEFSLDCDAGWTAMPGTDDGLWKTWTSFVARMKRASGFHQSEMGCMWPHRVDSPIYVYDQDSYDKYKSGEYQPPDHCICGAKIEYVTPVCLCLVRRGQMTGEMLMKVEMPISHVQVNLRGTDEELRTYKIDERTAKKLNAQADIRDEIDREEGAKLMEAVDEALNMPEDEKETT